MRLEPLWNAAELCDVFFSIGTSALFIPAADPCGDARRTTRIVIEIKQRSDASLALEHQSAASDRACLMCSGGLIKTPAASVRFSRNRPPSPLAPGQSKPDNSFPFSFPLSPDDGFWATLSLNIPDSRVTLARNAIKFRQALGLPVTMALYSFIGVAVTSATTIIYGQTIWDPVDVLTHFTNPVILVVAMLALCIATLATNIAATWSAQPTISRTSCRTKFPSKLAD